jgi:hypothetical protein
MDLRPLAELVREALGRRGLTLFAALVLLGVAFYVIGLGVDAATAVLHFIRELDST